MSFLLAFSHISGFQTELILGSKGRYLRALRLARLFARREFDRPFFFLLLIRP
jgi:hypothetical protein